MRLIDADEAIINFGFEWDDISPTRDEFVEFIKKQPTIEAETVKHGRWETNSDRPDSLICSICKCGFDMWKHDPHNYCPNCGAYMRGEEVGNENMESDGE